MIARKSRLVIREGSMSPLVQSTPLGTVRSRLNRSRKALRDALTQVFPDHDHFQAPRRIYRF